MNINDSLSAKLGEIQIKVLENITSLKELNDLIISIQKNYTKDDKIAYLWNKGFSKNKISKTLDIPYSTVSYKINKLIKDKKIDTR